MNTSHAAAWLQGHDSGSTASIWAPVVAALGASLLTALATFGVSWWQRRRDDQSAATTARLVAYRKFHARVFSFVRRVEVLRLANRLRSGIGEGLAVSLGHRQPLDPFTLYDWVEVDFRAVSDAWSEILTIGTQDAINIAGTLVEACGELMTNATATDTERRYLMRWIAGERATPDQTAAWETSRRQAYKVLETFANLVRQEGGQEAASLPLHRAEEEQAATA